MKTTLFTHVTVAFSCCLATFTACAGPETEIDPIGNAPVTISASISGEVVTKADNNYQPAEGNKKIFLYYKDGCKRGISILRRFAHRPGQGNDWLYRANPKCQRRLRQFRPADGIL